MKETTRNNSEEEISIASTLRSKDTEGWIDLIFYRPLGRRWALFFRKAGIAPNAITVAAIVLGVVAGSLFYFDDPGLNVTGMLLLIWANTYDSADGQLARMTGGFSEMGQLLNGVCRDFWFFAIYVAICCRLTPEWSYGIWILAAVAGYFHIQQVAMANYYRNIHLFFIKDEESSGLDYSAEIHREFLSLPWEDNHIWKIALWFYSKCTLIQEKRSPRFQELLRYLSQTFGEETSTQVGRLFRVGSLPLMKYTNVLAFNMRTLVLFASLLLRLPWIYFIFELTVLNVILYCMIQRHESFSHQLLLILKLK